MSNVKSFSATADKGTILHFLGGLGLVRNNDFDLLWENFCLRVDAWAKLKGWRSQPRGVVEFANNANGELSEAWEEYRIGEIAPYFKSSSATIRMDALAMVDESPDVWKPEGYWVEIADLVVRCADTMTEFDVPSQLDVLRLGYGFDELVFPLTYANIITQLRTKLSELDVITDEAVTLKERPGLNMVPVQTCAMAFVAAGACGVDLVELLDLKMRYNDTRAARHGGKIA